MCICGWNIYRNTTGGSLARQPDGKTTTGECRGLRRWIGFSGLESERVVSEDWVVRYANRYFQLEPQNRHYALARSKVLVCEGRHGAIAIEYRGRVLRWEEIPAPPQPRIESERQFRVRHKWVPSADHPWREAARRGAQRKASRGAVSGPPLASPCASP